MADTHRHYRYFGMPISTPHSHTRCLLMHLVVCFIEFHAIQLHCMYSDLLVHSTDAREYSLYIESRNLCNLIMSPFYDDC